MVIAFVFLIGILGKKLFDSIIDFISALRERKNKKSSVEQGKNPDQVSEAPEKEVSEDK
jgi:hypothetical protein